AIKPANRRLALVALGFSAILLRFAVNARPVAFPCSLHLYQAVRGCGSLHAHTAGSHHGEKRLHTVDAIPEQLGMMRLRRARALGLGISHLPDRPLPHLLCVFPETQPG